MLFYEAPHTLLATLRDLRDTFGPDRPIARCRELTTLHEEIRRTTLGEAADWYEATPPKGEFVLVVQGESAPQPEAPGLEQGLERVADLREEGRPTGRPGAGPLPEHPLSGRPERAGAAILICNIMGCCVITFCISNYVYNSTSVFPEEGRGRRGGKRSKKTLKRVFRLSVFPLRRESLLVHQLTDAVGADILALEVDDILGVITENTGGLILFQHDGRAVHIDLQGVLLRDVQGAAQLDGQHDAAQLVHLPYDAG